tara:strand:+ start:1690 stop:2664 length:975 start_codon:yes stop_codon:yes gene_type:complete
MNDFCLIKNKCNKSDINGYGSVDYSFFIQRNFITYKDFTMFLNDIGNEAIKLNIYDEHLQQVIYYSNNVFNTKDEIDINLPATYINLEKLQQYCNWKNNKEINNDDTIESSVSNKYWIPNYNEFYKSVYYNPYKQKYSIFPNNKDDVDKINVNENHISSYGLINAGFKFFNILRDNNKKNKYLIAGGAQNRHPSNAKAGVKFYVSNNYHSSYISGRLCKKCDTHTISILLYDVYGDGWQDNYIRVTDSSNNIIADKIALKDGYGPLSFDLQIETLEKYIYIIYVKNNNQHYENYYEIYKNSKCLFKSNQHETPPIKNKVFIGNE